MDQPPNKPLWVELAFPVIDKHQHALILIAVTMLFTAYSLPWSQLSDDTLLQRKLFFADDWSWAAMMIPIVLGMYWHCVGATKRATGSGC